MDNSKNRQNGDHLGVNKIGKNIRKSPLHQPNFANTDANPVANNATPARQQPQPQVYNISKNDFRNIVQQLTGSPSQDQCPPPRPTNSSPRAQSMRLQKIRPPPLTPLNRPRETPPVAAQPPMQAPYNNYSRPPAQFAGPPQPAPVDPYSQYPTDSPISAYMRYLQSSMDPSPVGNLSMPQPQATGHVLGPPSSGILPNPPPRFNGPPQHMNGPALLPSPTSQFPLPSPSSYLNLLSPRSPYPLLSPGVQFPPLTPSFTFSPLAQSGILGPGPHPPPSPGQYFPLSPSGFFALPSPRWSNQ